MITKYCSKCGNHFPANENYFHTNNHQGDGLHIRCKACACLIKKELKQGVMKKEKTVSTVDGMKYCNTCHELLPANNENFNKQAKSKDGLENWCRTCSRNYKRIKRYGTTELRKVGYIKTLETGIKHCSRCHKILPATTEHFHSCKSHDDGLASHCVGCWRKYYEENIELCNFYTRRYYWANHDDFLKRLSINRKKNRAKETERDRKYRQIHPEKSRFHNQKRRSLLRKSIHNLTKDTWDKCKDYFDNGCAYCGEKAKDLSHEHVIPLSKGGAFTSGNIIPACKTCNTRKQAQDLNVWYPKQPFFTQKRFKRIIKWISYDPSKAQQYSMF